MFCSLFPTKKQPQPTKNYLLWEKSGPNATFNLLRILPWVGLALGWGVRRFHNNVHMFHLRCIAHKKKSEDVIFRTNTRLESPLPPLFLRTTFRNFRHNSGDATPRSSLWCSHCSVAKRQQFSCPLGTATLSLKLENVVLGCWICGSRLLDLFSLVLWPSVFLTAPPSMSSTRT